MELQSVSLEVYNDKYRIHEIDNNIQDTYRRVAKSLAEVEKLENREYWETKFYWALENGATPGGRILANAGAEKYKPNVSLINCVVSKNIHDSIEGIMSAASESAITLSKGSGIGYCFSSLRPKGSYINGVGARTAGSISFMEIFNTMCFTINSAGGRRGAQMATHFCWHPDIEEFINAKKENGRFRQFNFSILITDDFLKAVEENSDWELYFPIHIQEYKNLDIVERSKLRFKYFPFNDLNYVTKANDSDSGFKLCKIYKTVKAKYLWELILRSTYEYSEPGILLYDRINNENNNWFCEDLIACNPCGEQNLPEYGNCLLGSINLTKFVIAPFTNISKFDFDTFSKVVDIFTRMLDNVVEKNGLQIQQQIDEMYRKRRHGMGIYGLGSALVMMKIKYGSKESIEFTEKVMKKIAERSYLTGYKLAEEKNCAQIFIKNRKIDSKIFNRITYIKENYKDIYDGLNWQFNIDRLEIGDEISTLCLWLISDYMIRFRQEFPEIWNKLGEHGCRFTHATTIAPTGTTSLSIGNNASNGIEPSFSHEYKRNIIVEGKKTKKQTSVYSYEFLLYKELIDSETDVDDLPEYFVDSHKISTLEHILIQSAAQKWVDSSVSKTINVRSDISFEDFQNVYNIANENNLKGCATFRFNPEVFSGVLVNDKDLKKTRYKFNLENGDFILAYGDDEIVYDGEKHIASNLFDSIKEGLYGRF